MADVKLKTEMKKVVFIRSKVAIILPPALKLTKKRVLLVSKISSLWFSTNTKKCVRLFIYLFI